MQIYNFWRTLQYGKAQGQRNPATLKHLLRLPFSGILQLQSISWGWKLVIFALMEHIPGLKVNKISQLWSTSGYWRSVAERSHVKLHLPCETKPCESSSVLRDEVMRSLISLAGWRHTGLRFTDKKKPNIFLLTDSRKLGEAYFLSQTQHLSLASPLGQTRCVMPGLYVWEFDSLLFLVRCQVITRSHWYGSSDDSNTTRKHFEKWDRHNIVREKY